MSNPLTLEKEGNIGVIWIDSPGEEWNKIGTDTEKYLNQIMEQIDGDEEIKAAVLISRKKGFMAGADIERFLEMKPGETKDIVISGHHAFNRIEDSRKPYIAAIHGACMGGGLEISLACAGRVVSNHPSTVLALPEVKLGLLPGLGGTRRLPRTIGIQKGLDAILTGRNIYGYRAYKIGLADEIVDQTKLLTAAKKLALKIAEGKYKRKDKRSLAEKLLEGNVITRNIIFNKAKQITLAKTYGNYPAALKIIESVKYGSTHDREASTKKEAELFDELLAGPVAYQLINIFFGMNALKKNPLKDKAKPVSIIGVLGAGLMGQGISEVSLNNGLNVMMRDINQEMLTSARRGIWRSLEKKVRNRSILKADAQRIINQLATNLEYQGFAKTSVVIEAVFEDLDLKHNVLAEVEEQISDEAVFASNTSSLPISKIASKSKIPERVLGMHYFSPVPKMPLLEIIVTDKTADWARATALEVGVRQGKVCIVVNDGPGFYTTRILAPFMNEALLMLEEGGDILQIDKAMRRFGFPVGPFTLMDEVGIDVGAHINRGDLGVMFADRGGKASPLMEKLEAAGFKGRKNRNGFLQYDESGKKVREKINPTLAEQVPSQGSKKFEIEEIQQRISLMMINEAAHCLQEGIIASPRDGDIGAVFGLGFPPFLGGPFRYIDTIGLEGIRAQLVRWSTEYGERFKPADILTNSGKKFYQS